MPAREIGGDAGRFIKDRDPVTGDPVRGIALNRNLTATQAPRVLGHEVGHVVEDLAGRIPNDGIVQDLRKVYNTLNNPEARRRAIDTPVRFMWGPESAGYKAPPKVNQELMAEAIRAYMQDPNYLKSVAPRIAERIHEYANPIRNEFAKKYIQFNSLAVPLAVGGFGALQPGPQPEERY